MGSQPHTSAAGGNAAVAVVVVLAILVAPRWATAEPENMRQAEEGYWVGGRPDVADMPGLYEQGIRLIVSSVYLNQRRRRACEAAGIDCRYIRIGSTFPDPDEFLALTADYPAEQIYLHCTHGADRAGAMLAFLLVIRDGWRPDHALLAVSAPGRWNVNQVVDVLEEHGLLVTEAERERYAGLYSGASNGGEGGMKAHEDRYRNLIASTLEALAQSGIQLDETAEPAELDASEPSAGVEPTE
jgi:hypothetical protein